MYLKLCSLVFFLYMFFYYFNTQQLLLSCVEVILNLIDFIYHVFIKRCCNTFIPSTC